MKVNRSIQRRVQLLWHHCLVNGVPDSARLRAAVTDLTSRRPRHYQRMLAELLRLMRLDNASRQAVVETAVPLAAARQADLTQALQRLHGEGTHVEFVALPAVIGGMRVRVGSTVYDGTVKARLERLVTILES